MYLNKDNYRTVRLALWDAYRSMIDQGYHALALQNLRLYREFLVRDGASLDNVDFLVRVSEEAIADYNAAEAA
jgi:hypothetical protein